MRRDDPAHAEDTQAFRARLSRRQALGALGLGAAGLYGLRTPVFGPEAATGACLLQRESTEGPFYLDLDLVRRDIRGGRPGTPLTLRFGVVDASTCRALPGATVEVWHCDASGVYSGVDGDEGTFLRGVQRANSRGRVRFDTIVPGWYPGRTPHVHTKVFVGSEEVHTGQVYFRQDVLRRVHAQGVYRARGTADTGNRADGFYGSAGARAIVAMRRKGSSVAAGYTGSLVLGVSR